MKILVCICAFCFVLIVPGETRTAKKETERSPPWSCLTIPEIPQHKEVVPNTCFFGVGGESCCRYDREKCTYFLCRKGCSKNWDLVKQVCGKDRKRSKVKPQVERSL